MEYTKDQINALNIIKDWWKTYDRNNFLAIAGYSGTGKTTLIADLPHHLKKVTGGIPQLSYATLTAKGGKVEVSGSNINTVNASNKGQGEVSIYRSTIDTLNATTNHGDIRIDAEPNAKNEIGTLNAKSTNGNIKIWDTNFTRV